MPDAVLTSGTAQVEERLHEALSQQVPVSLCDVSSREMPERLPRPEYPGHFEVRRVSRAGIFRFLTRQLFLTPCWRKTSAISRIRLRHRYLLQLQSSSVVPQTPGPTKARSRSELKLGDYNHDAPGMFIQRGGEYQESIH